MDTIEGTVVGGAGAGTNLAAEQTGGTDRPNTPTGPCTHTLDARDTSPLPLEIKSTTSMVAEVVLIIPKAHGEEKRDIEDSLVARAEDNRQDYELLPTVFLPDLHSTAVKDLITNSSQTSGSSTYDSSAWPSTITSFPKFIREEMMHLLIISTRAITLIDTDKDGVPDFLTNIITSQDSLTEVIITTDHLKPFPTHLEPIPFPSVTSVMVTHIPFDSSHFLTITVTSSLSPTQSPTNLSAPGPIASAGSKLSMAIGIGVAVGVAIMAFGAAYCCYGKKHMIAAKFRWGKKDRGKARAPSTGRAAEEGVGGNSRLRGQRYKLVAMPSSEDNGGLVVDQYHTPDVPQEVGMHYISMDSLHSQTSNSGLPGIPVVGTGYGYSPIISPLQLSRSDNSNTEANKYYPRIGNHQGISTPAASPSSVVHRNPTASASTLVRSPIRSGQIHRHEQVQQEAQKRYNSLNVLKRQFSKSRSSRETAHAGNANSPFIRDISPQTSDNCSRTPRQQRWVPLADDGEGNSAVLLCHPKVVEGGNVTVRSACGHEGSTVSVANSMAPPNVIEEELQGSHEKQLTDDEDDAHASSQRNPVKYNVRHGSPSFYTTCVVDDGPQPTLEVSRHTPVYPPAGYTTAQNSHTRIGSNTINRTNTPQSRAQPSPANQSADPRHFTYTPDSPVHFGAVAEPAILPGPERKASTVTLTVIKPLSVVKPQSRSRSSSTTTTSTSRAGTNRKRMGTPQGDSTTNNIGIAMPMRNASTINGSRVGTPQSNPPLEGKLKRRGRFSFGSSSWTDSLHPSDSCASSATSSVNGGRPTGNLRRQPSAVEQVAAGVRSPLENMVREHLPKGTAYGETDNVEAGLEEANPHPKKVDLKDWIRSSSSRFGDPEQPSIVGTVSEIESDAHENGLYSTKRGVWKVAETVVDTDSVSRVGVKKMLPIGK